MEHKNVITIRRCCIWLMAALYIIMPSYLSFEISSQFPAFTASRVVLLLTLFLFVILEKRIMVPKAPEMKWIYVASFLAIVANIVHLGDSGSYSIKAIFSIVLENLLLIVVLYNILNSSKSIYYFIKIMVMTSAIVTFFAIIEFATSYNVFYLFTTTSRTVYQAAYVRSGMTRAEASFGHSVYYGVYCTCMLPFSLYLYENTKKRKYLLFAMLNIVGVLISGSRGQMVAGAVAMFLMLCKKRGEIKKEYYRAIILGVIVLGILVIFIPGVFSYISENVKSILNIIGFNFQISKDFGINAGGLDSRTIQLSGLKWLMINGVFLFGLGSRSAARGLVSYYWNSYGWQVVKSVDVGYVGWFLEYGLVGALGYAALFVGITLRMNRKSNEKDVANIFNPYKWFTICYLLNLLSSTGLDKLLWVVLGLMVASEHVDRQAYIVGENR